MRRIALPAAGLLLLVLVTSSVTVAHGEATDATKSIATGDGLQYATSGTAASFTVTALDGSAVRRTSGGDNFLVELEGTRSMTGSVVDNLDGTYAVSYTATKSGTYEASVKLAKSGGLSAAYYENVWFFYTPVKTTVDPQINMDWGTGLLTPTGADYISVRWQGKIKPQFAETYTFFATTDDGAKLWVDNVPLVDRWDSFCNETSATISLHANVFYNIKMEYKEVVSTAYARLSWASQSTPKEIIPSAQLYYETHIKQSPFSFIVQPSVACAVASTAAGQGLAIATAGTAAQLTVQCNDEYDNERGIGENTFAVRVYPPTSGERPVHAVVVDNTDSSYSVEYTTYKAGASTLRSTLLTAGGLYATYYDSATDFVNAKYVTCPADASAPCAGYRTGSNWLNYATSADGIFPTEACSDASCSRTTGIAWHGRWEGLIQAPGDGTYTFEVTGSHVNDKARMYIDNKLLLDYWTTTLPVSTFRVSATIDLRSNYYYDLKVDYFASQASASALIVKATGSGYTGNALLSSVSSSLFAGDDVSQSPFSVDVKPAATCAAQSFSTDTQGSLSLSTAGMQAQFTVTARDLYGNLRLTGNENFKVRLSGVDSNSGLVQDQADGSYKVFYTPSKSGTYDISIVYGASGIANSPYRMYTQPARRHLSNSVPTSQSLTLATAGVEATVTITIKDRHDNWQPSPGVTNADIDFFLDDGTYVEQPVSPQSAPSFADGGNAASSCDPGQSAGQNTRACVATPTSLDTPTLVLKYTVTKSGQYGLSVKGSTSHDGDVKDSPFSLSIFPNLPCSVTSTASGDSLSLVTAGSAATFTVQSRDWYYNLRGTHVGDNFVARIRQLDPGSLYQDLTTSASVHNTYATGGTNYRDKLVNVVDEGDSTYTMDFTATKSTTNQLWTALAIQGGLYATYFNSAPRSAYPANERAQYDSSDQHETVYTIDYSETGGGPGSTTNEFLARYAGLIQPGEVAGSVYTFTAESQQEASDCVIVWIDNAKIIDACNLASHSATMTFPLSNGYYDLRVDYYDNDAGATADSKIVVKWASANTAAAVVPSERLFRQDHVSSSPFTVTVKPSGACATTSTVRHQSISLATAGVVATFTVQAKDEFDNLRESGGDDFGFALLSSADVPDGGFFEQAQPSYNDGGSVGFTSSVAYLAAGGELLGAQDPQQVADCGHCYDTANAGSRQCRDCCSSPPLDICHGFTSASSCNTAGCNWDLTETPDRCEPKNQGPSVCSNVLRTVAATSGHADACADAGCSWEASCSYGTGGFGTDGNGCCIPTAAWQTCTNQLNQGGGHWWKGSGGGYETTYTATLSGRYSLRGQLFQPGGVYGWYYENEDLSDHGQFFDAYASNAATASTYKPFLRVDAGIDFQWTTGSPVTTAEASARRKTIGPDFFSVRWEGAVKPDFTDVYTFYAEVDDGAKLWIDDLLIVNHWYSRCSEVAGTIPLVAGQLYNLKMEFKEVMGNATARLRWSSRGMKTAMGDSSYKQVVPSSSLYYRTTSAKLSRLGLPLDVEPAVVCSTTSSATGVGMTTATAGNMAEFTITARDEYGNMRKFPYLGKPFDLQSQSGYTCEVEECTVKQDANHEWNSWSEEHDFIVRVVPILSGGQRPYHASVPAEKLGGKLWVVNQNPAIKDVGAEDPAKREYGRIMRVANSAYPGGLTATYYNTNALGSDESVKVWIDQTIDWSGTDSDDAASTGVPPLCHDLQFDQAQSAGRIWCDGGVQNVEDNEDGVADPASSADISTTFQGAVETTVCSCADNLGGNYAALGVGTAVKDTGSALNDAFAARWEGFVRPSLSTLYTFTTTVQDDEERMRLWVDNKLIVDQWTSLASQAFTGTTGFATAEDYYDIKMDYRTANAATSTGRGFQLQWKNEDSTQTAANKAQQSVIPSTRLYPLADRFKVQYTAEVKGDYQLHVGVAESNGLDATFYDDMELTNPTATREDEAVLFECSASKCVDFPDGFGGTTTSSPGGVTDRGDHDARRSAVGLSDKHSFSVRWAGLLLPWDPEATRQEVTYTFFTKIAEEDERVRLWVDNMLIIDKWDTYEPLAGTTFSATITLKAPRYYDVKMEYKDYGGVLAKAELHWERSTKTSEPIPSARLFKLREVSGSPFAPFELQASPTCSSHSTVRGAALSLATSGVKWSFTVQSHDEYDNERGEGGDLYVSRLVAGADKDATGTRGHAHNSIKGCGCTIIDTGSCVPTPCVRTYETAVSGYSGNSAVGVSSSTRRYSTGSDNSVCNDCPITVHGEVVDLEDSGYVVSYNGTRRGQYEVITSLAYQGGLWATYYDGAADDAARPHTYGGSGVGEEKAALLDTTIDFSVSTGSGPRCVADSAFSARWIGFVRPSVTTEYTFTMDVQGLATERYMLAVDNAVLIDKYNGVTCNTPTTSVDCAAAAATVTDTDDKAATIAFPIANHYYDLHVEYKQHAAGSSSGLLLKWKSGGQTIAVVPSDRLFSRLDVPNEAALNILVEETDAGVTFATGHGLTSATAGVDASFTITAKDSFGNERQLEEDSFAVRIQGPSALHNVKPEAAPTSPGSYHVSYSTTEAGLYTVAILRGTPGGLEAEYFNNMWLLGDAADNRIDESVDFDWGNSAVSGRTSTESVVTGADYVSVRWTGYFKPELSELYTFHAAADDGVRLYVDNVKVVDQWDTSAGVHSATFPATQDLMVDLKMEYKEATGPAHARLEYSSASVVQRVVPSSRLYHRCSCKYNNDGVYACSSSPCGEPHVWGSPYRLYVNPHDTCSVASTLDGPGLSQATTGNTASFTVVAKDEYHNLKTRWGDVFVVRAQANAPTTLAHPRNTIDSCTSKLLTAGSMSPDAVCGSNMPKAGTASENVQRGMYNFVFEPTTCGPTQVWVALASGAGGLQATYYDGEYSSSQATVDKRYSLDNTVDWSGESVTESASSGITSPWSARWIGFVQPTSIGEYTFQVGLSTVVAEEKVRLWVDNKMIIDGFTNAHVATNPSATIAFGVSNSLYDIKLDYFDTSATTASKVQLKWKSGTVAMAVIASDRLWQANEVAGSPYDFVTQPDVTDYAVSTIFGEALTIATAGVTSAFTLQSKDMNGNHRDSGGDDYKVHVAKAAGAVFAGTLTDSSDGGYVATYTPSEQGAYNLKTYLGTSDKSVALTVEPGAACASTCTANGDALTLSTAGFGATFTIQTKDEYANLRTIGYNEFIVRLTGPGGDGGNGWSTSWAHQDEGVEEHNAVVSYLGAAPNTDLGKYRVQYRTSRSGDFSMDVKLVKQNGLNAAYYRDNTLTESVLTTVDDAIDFNWGTDTPHTYVGIVDGFSVQWSGYFKPQYSQTYSFTPAVSGGDERVRLWVDDHWVVEQWTSLSATNPVGTIGLIANALYDIKLQYKDDDDTAQAVLMYNTANVPLREVPSSRLFSVAENVAGSPFSMTSYPARTSGVVSTAMGPGMTLATSGIVASFTIQAKDHLGNDKTTSNDVFTVRARHQNQWGRRNIHGTVTSLSGGSGRYSVVYTPTYKHNRLSHSEGGPWHDVAVSLSLPGGLSSTYYDTNTAAAQSRDAVGEEIVSLVASGAAADDNVAGVGAGNLMMETLATTAAAHYVDVIDSTYASGSGPKNTAGTADTDGKFSLRYEGLVRPAYAELYTFKFTVTDKTKEDVRVWVDNSLLIDKFCDDCGGDTVTPTGAIQFGVANGLYDIKVDYVAGADAGNAITKQKLSWESASQADQTVPSERLWQAIDLSWNTFEVDGLTATYYDQDSGGTPGGNTARKVIIDETVDWSHGDATGRPYPGSITGNSAYSVRWIGFVRPSRRDQYTFYLKAEDLANEKMKVWVDNQVIIDNWGTGTAATATSGLCDNAAGKKECYGTIGFPAANDYYDIKVEYKNGDPSSSMFSLQWENLGGERWAYHPVGGVYTSTGGGVPDDDKCFRGVIRSDRLFQSRSSSMRSESGASYQCSGGVAAQGSRTACTAITSRGNDYSSWDWAGFGGCNERGVGRRDECWGQGERWTDALHVDVKPAVACASKSTSEGVALTISTTGVARTFTLTARDEYENQRDAIDDSYLSRALPTRDTHPLGTGDVTGSTGHFHGVFRHIGTPQGDSNLAAWLLSDSKDPTGVYDVSYTITRSGQFSQEVSLGDAKGNGVYGTYFSKKDLTGPVTTKVDSGVDFNWGKGSPVTDAAVGVDNFSVRWIGYVKPQYSEVYTFWTTSDDGVRLWVNGYLLVNQWGGSGGSYSGTVQLNAGVLYDLKMEYQEVSGNAYSELRWSSTSTPKAVVPASRLFPSNQVISGGLTSLTVYPHVNSASVSTAFGPGLTIATTGISASFTVQSKDEYGNMRTTETDDTYYIRVIPDDAATAPHAKHVMNDLGYGTINGVDGTSATLTCNDAAGTCAQWSDVGSNQGRHIFQYRFTRTGSHNVYVSLVRQGGLSATYYETEDFGTPRVARACTNVYGNGGVWHASNNPDGCSLGRVAANNRILDPTTVDWSGTGGATPVTLANDQYSVRWQGVLEPSTAATEVYTFSTDLENAASDERVRLWVDNYLLIDQWTSIGVGDPSGTIVLKGTGNLEFYDIKVEYKSLGTNNDDKIKLEWKSAGTNGNAKQVIPSTALYEAYTVTNEPKRVRMNPNVACSVSSTRSGDGLTIATAGIQAGFTITSIDAYGNLRGTGSDVFVVRAFPTSQATCAGSSTEWGFPASTNFGGGTSDSRDCTATCQPDQLKSGPTHVTVTNQGSGYTSAPTVDVSGGGGADFAATAVLDGDRVVRVTITNHGNGGYTSAPTIGFTGGGGSGAAATAVFGTCGSDARPVIVRATVVDKGDCTYGVTYTATKRGTYNVFSSLVNSGGLYATFYNDDTVTSGSTPQANAGVGANIVSEQTIDWSVAATSFPAAVSDNVFHAKWEGFVKPSRAAEYTFYVQLYDNTENVKLYMDNSVVIDQWTSAGSGGGDVEYSGTLSFGMVNHFYDLRLHYYARAGNDAGLQLKWQSTGSGVAADDVAKGVVRSSRLFFRSDVRDNCKKWGGSGVNHCSGNQDTEASLSYGKDGTNGNNYKDGGTVTETVFVHPTTTCSSTSESTGSTLSLTTSGTANTFTVTARDAYDNIRTLNNDMTFTVDLHGSGGLPVYQGSVASHTMTSSGVYIASYTVTAAKNYELFVKYGNDNVKSSPFTMMNRPVDTSGTRSTVTGTGLTAAAVGAKSAFTVQARDQYANARTKGASDVFVVRVVRSSAGNLPELGSTGIGGNRAMQTLHGTLGTATDDGKHAGYYQVPSTGTGSTYFHTSLALNGAGDMAGLQATYYSASGDTPPTTIGTNDKLGSWYSAVTDGNMPKSVVTGATVHRIRWRGFYKATATQVHTFKTTLSNVASRARLWIDNQLVIDQWTSVANLEHTGPSSSLTSGNYYDFCVDLFATNAAHDVNVKIDTTGSYADITDGELWNVVDVSGSPFQVTVSS